MRLACSNNNLDIIIWLYEIKSDINLEIYDNIIFENCCQIGSYQICEWLWDKLNPESIALILANCFYLACINNNLKIAEWLYGKNYQFNISENNEEIFVSYCKKGYIDVGMYYRY